MEVIPDDLGQVRNVLLILAITAAMALATAFIMFAFDMLPDISSAAAVPKG